MDNAYDQERGGTDRRPLSDGAQASPDDEPVLRVEFYGNAGPRGARPDTEAAVPVHARGDATVTPPESGRLASTVGTEPDIREQVLAKREGMIAAQEAEAMSRASELARREQALAGSEGLIEAESADVERRERRLAQMESTLQARTQELDDRELTVERREAELEAAFSMREDRVEAREAELAELQTRLERKEQDLSRYVTQVQAEFARRS